MPWKWGSATSGMPAWSNLWQCGVKLVCGHTTQ
jgi:hypothetical protein